jgi:hypothetical protein
VAGPANKYNFSGIGGASSKLVLAALTANPSTLWLTVGIMGTISDWILSWAFSCAASVGLVVLNLGAEQVESLIAQNQFDGSWDSAEKLLNAAHDAHQSLTPAQIAAIDQPVIDSFRKFAQIADGKLDPNA